MSRESVEIVNRAMEAWNSHDLGAVLAVVDPEAEYVNAPEAVEPGTRRGPAEITTVLRAHWQMDLHQEIERFHVRGNEVFTEGRVSRAMPGSEARIDNRVLVSWRIRAGKITRIQVLGAGSAFERALAAAGLEEEDRG